MAQTRKRTGGRGVSVSLDPQLLAQVDREAGQEGVTRAEAIRRLLRRALGQKDEAIPEELVEQGMILVTEERMARGGEGIPLAKVKARFGL